MEINHIDHFFLHQEEPQKGCFLALREIILRSDQDFTEHWKYKLPFYYYKSKPFCYLWKNKKTQEPYIGLVRANQIEHPMLIQGNRAKMKILPISPSEDIPVDMIYGIFERLKKTYY